ncbi:MAG: hypothetical protein ACKVS8_01250 [Phycisphaerales bacterium]
MALKVSRAREQVGQWMVVSVVTAFVASMGLMAYAKYIDDRYGELPGEPRPVSVQRAQPEPEPAATEGQEAKVEAVSFTPDAAAGARPDPCPAAACPDAPAKEPARGPAIGREPV